MQVKTKGTRTQKPMCKRRLMSFPIRDNEGNIKSSEVYIVRDYTDLGVQVKKVRPTTPRYTKAPDGYTLVKFINGRPLFRNKKNPKKEYLGW